LHDSGETWGANEDAPSYTIEGLKHALTALQKRGVQFTRIDEIAGNNLPVRQSHV